MIVVLCRFAQFFLCPLFDESCKDREVNAVDSEHEKNLMNDAWRLFQLEKATGNPDHPFSKFGTGMRLNQTRTHTDARPPRTARGFFFLLEVLSFDLGFFAQYFLQALFKLPSIPFYSASSKRCAVESSHVRLLRSR